MHICIQWGNSAALPLHCWVGSVVEVGTACRHGEVPKLVYVFWICKPVGPPVVALKTQNPGILCFDCKKQHDSATLIIIDPKLYNKMTFKKKWNTFKRHVTKLAGTISPPCKVGADKSHVFVIAVCPLHFKLAQLEVQWAHSGHLVHLHAKSVCPHRSGVHISVCTEYYKQSSFSAALQVP